MIIGDNVEAHEALAMADEPEMAAPSDPRSAEVARAGGPREQAASQDAVLQGDEPQTEHSSPDPLVRTDRYRLVTPYSLRL